ncbi:hypothetical protein Q5L94_11180 [Idiomarina sp. Sol25]|uniref:hypothetical protein n=1 Tax=Idiomarina sp. Sol25 TaxID=3064000 RepID=UPI00294B7A40|nr:hypothetical protein [Idiomarina sp. Sol25]MDV6328628.1 hypothetical protein [Idiomarina sp. Sol25]
MTKVFEAKLIRFREELTTQLTSSEVDVNVLENAIQVYCSLLPDYSDELRHHLPPQDVAKNLQKEILFAQHVMSSLENLKSERKQALLTVMKGRKATSKY